MSFIKKIFIFIFLLVFIFNSSNIVSATLQNGNYDNSLSNSLETYKINLLKDIKEKKEELYKIKSGDKIVKKIYFIIEENKDNKEILLKTQSKIWNLLSNNSKKGKKITIILEYFDLKIEYALLEIKERKNIEEKEKDKILDKKISDFLDQKGILKDDKKKVEELFKKIQKKLANKIDEKLEFVTKKFEKYTSYEQKGDFNLKFFLDENSFGKIKASLLADNYEYKNNLFDAQLKAKIKGLIEAQKKGEKAFKTEFSSFLDYILKDGNTYLLLKDLKIVTDSNEEKIKNGIKRFKKIFSNNKYIRIEDRQYKEILTNLKKFNIFKLKNDINLAFSKSFFTPYKKQGNKYYLLPTKHFCDKYKELNYKFYPWNGKDCSENQYKKMLKEFLKSGDLYLEIGNKNKLVFVAFPDDDVKSFKTELVFTDSDLLSFYSKLEAIENEGFELDYQKNKKLDFKFFANAGNLKINLNSILNKNNKFTFIDFKLFVKQFKEKIIFNLNLKNKKLFGNYTYTGEIFAGYEPQTRKVIYVPIKNTITISGVQDASYNYKDFAIKYKNTNLKNNKLFLDLDFQKKSDNYIFSVKSNNLKTGDKNYLLDISFNNGLIKGQTLIYKQNKEKLKISHSGRYARNYFQLNNDFDFSKAIFEKSKISKGNINLEIDARYNRNNSKLDIKYIEGGKKILEYNFENRAVINYLRKIEIITPKEYIEQTKLY